MMENDSASLSPRLRIIRDSTQAHAEDFAILSPHAASPALGVRMISQSRGAGRNATREFDAQPLGVRACAQRMSCAGDFVEGGEVKKGAHLVCGCAPVLVATHTPSQAAALAYHSYIPRRNE
jgi:hypothetical protein